MPNWVHRTTKDQLLSVAPADLPEAEANYIRDPDLSMVRGQPTKYWTIVGDAVVLQTPAEQAATDAAEDAQQRQNARPSVVARVDDPLGMDIRALIELFNKRDNYLTNRIIEIQQALDAIKATSGPADNIRGAIPGSWLPTSTRPRPAAVQDYKDSVTSGSVDT